MKVTDANGDSWSPMVMEFNEINSTTANPRMLHLIRVTGWPVYMNHILQIQGKAAKDENGEWTTYGGPGNHAGWQNRTAWQGWSQY